MKKNNLNKSTKKGLKAFSIAEAFIMLIIISVALGLSAPLISKQIKQNNFSNAQTSILLSRIEQLEAALRNNQQIQSGAIMFYNRNSCPDGWSEIRNLGGHYPRIATFENDRLIDTINSTKEQMVHKHKHVSPIIRPNYANNYRYGPFAPENQRVIGDATYTNTPNSLPDNIYYPYPATAAYRAWFMYTSDGMNRPETLSRSGDFDATTYNVIVCPNRDENDTICKNDGTNTYGTPYLADMPLVGNENRPNSVIWLACQRD